MWSQLSFYAIPSHLTNSWQFILGPISVHVFGYTHIMKISLVIICHIFRLYLQGRMQYKNTLSVLAHWGIWSNRVHKTANILYKLKSLPLLSHGTHLFMMGGRGNILVAICKKNAMSVDVHMSQLQTFMPVS